MAALVEVAWYLASVTLVLPLTTSLSACGAMVMGRRVDEAARFRGRWCCVAGNWREDEGGATLEIRDGDCVVQGD